MPGWKMDEGSDMAKAKLGKMSSCCDFRNDSLESLVECFLGCDDGGDYAAIFEDGSGCGFIAGRFNR
jgi:hypothetical protein